MDAFSRLEKIQPSNNSTVDVSGLREKCMEAICDDLNSPIVISHLFDACRSINLVSDGKASISEGDLEELRSVFNLFLFDILGLQLKIGTESSSDENYKGAIELLLQMRMEAKAKKDWATSDKIRNELSALGFEIKDTKDGFEWKLSR